MGPFKGSVGEDGRVSADPVFRKGSASAPDGYFRWEAAGLAWLADAPGGVPVVEVVEVGQDHLDLRRLSFVNPDPAMAEEFGAAAGQDPRRRGPGVREPTRRVVGGRLPRAGD